MLIKARLPWRTASRVPRSVVLVKLDLQELDLVIYLAQIFQQLHYIYKASINFSLIVIIF